MATLVRDEGVVGSNPITPTTLKSPAAQISAQKRSEPDLLLRRTADISPCGAYRYRLTRHWDESKRALVFIMLNPSTADAEIDDPTIRRCMGFARREGLGGIEVLNLYAYRATDPDVLFEASEPVGPQNGIALHNALEAAAESGEPIVCAWGARGVRSMHFVQRAKSLGTKLVALGVTKEGHPRHPLYVRADQPFIEYPSRTAPSTQVHGAFAVASDGGRRANG